VIPTTNFQETVQRWNGYRILPVPEFEMGEIAMNMDAKPTLLPTGSLGDKARIIRAGRLLGELKKELN
jgi:hypothetical protein